MSDYENTIDADQDSKLMLSYKNGNQKAFETLYTAYKGKLYNFAYRYCRNSKTAEDLSQEVFVRICRAADTYMPTAKFSTWLYRIAVNVCINEIKSSSFQREFPASHMIYENNYNDEAPYSSYVNAEAKYVELKDLIQHLRFCIEQLPDRMRMILEMNVYQELTHKEISRRIGCTESAVKTCIFRAKKKLKSIALVYQHSCSQFMHTNENKIACHEKAAA